MSRLSGCSFGLSSNCRVGELFIDCRSRCPVCLAIRSVYRLTYRVGELFIDCKSRCPVCLAVHSVCRLTVGWESYLSTVRVGVQSVSLIQTGLSSDYRVGELFIDCKSRCPVCQTIQSVYRLAIGLENYLSTVRVGVPSVWLFIRSIV